MDVAGSSKDVDGQVGTGSKGPGAMLHSALRQLQAELKREALANEKLMVKAETLLKGGGPDSDKADGGSSGSSSAEGFDDRRPDGAAQVSEEEQRQLRRQLKEMADQVQHREKENERLKIRVKDLQREATCGPFSVCVLRICR